MAQLHQLIVIFSAFWIITQCLADYYSPANYDNYYQVPAYYQYSWQVKDLPSGNDYRQQETRDGHLTTGLYQVLLPGGRHQTVNYRVDKDSGFMADVSYQGENNYFTFKSNYQHQMSDADKTPIPQESMPPAAYQSYSPVIAHNTPEAYYPSSYDNYATNQPAYISYNSAIQKQQQANSYYYPARQQPQQSYPVQQQFYPAQQQPQQSYPTRNKYGFDDEPVVKTTTATPVTIAPVTTELITTQIEMDYAHQPDYSVPMYPLYRADFYSARAKAGKSVTQSPDNYGVDEEGYTYIKPSAKYSIPDKLGSYEINHRKATVRKPSLSDYQAPEAIIQSK